MVSSVNTVLDIDHNNCVGVLDTDSIPYGCGICVQADRMYMFGSIA